jgi:hypothetical protein
MAVKIIPVSVKEQKQQKKSGRVIRENQQPPQPQPEPDLIDPGLALTERVTETESSHSCTCGSRGHGARR